MVGSLSRRAAILGIGVTAAWLDSPVRALMRPASKSLPTDLEALISRMTLDEKAGQLTLMGASWPGGVATTLNPATRLTNFQGQLQQVRAGLLTGAFNGAGAVMAQRMQTVVMTEGRLKIPLIFAADVIHGYQTIFPVPLGEAASFEPELARRTARAAALEASAAGIDWTFAPTVDIARDARWGRGVEGSGEDVLLGCLMAAARVRGFQGDDGMTTPDAVATCAKHFAAYGAAAGGLDYNTVDVSERTLRNVYFPPFKAAFAAGAPTVMPSFNEIAGVPSTANPWLLQDVLRREWGFDGVVVSDYTADAELVDHGLAADAREAAKLAFLAGVDISMHSGLYRKFLPDLVTKGEVPVARLDEAVRRVLALKAKLGLFDDPFRRIHPDREKSRMRMPETLKLAREAGAKSIVMLKNDDHLLPLPSSGKKIALIGPFVAGQHDLIGPWNVFGKNAEAIDLATGVTEAVSDRASISVTLGSAIEESMPGGIEAAVAAASAADIVVLAIGEGQAMSGEAQSRSDIVVPAPQMALAEAVTAVGKPVVILLRTGRALALKGAVLSAPVILVTWFLGSEDGRAIADVLFGKVGPSARLPVSFPHATGQEPYHYDHKNTGRPNPAGAPEKYKTHYREFGNDALFAFGHGLTYGDITYSDLDLGQAKITAGQNLNIRAKIRNAGPRAADEVVQLYIRDLAAEVTRPVRELKAFQKISLQPGQQKEVVFTLERSELSYLGQDLKTKDGQGEFGVWIAPSAQATGVHGTFSVA